MSGTDGAKAPTAGAPVKVAYNACYGGFSLSTEAVQLARRLSGNPNWGDCTLVGEPYSDGSGVREESFGSDSHHLDSSYPRHDPVLIEVIETLGSLASGECASLEVATLKGDRYIVDEYGGFESVQEPEDISWITVDQGGPTGSPKGVAPDTAEGGVDDR